MTAVVGGRESAYHHRKWTSSTPAHRPVRKTRKTQELSHEPDQAQGAGQSDYSLLGFFLHPSEKAAELREWLRGHGGANTETQQYSDVQGVSEAGFSIASLAIPIGGAALRLGRAVRALRGARAAAEAGSGTVRACEGGLCGIPGKTCFVAGTLIRTERGEVPIEQLKAGDRVWSRNTLTGKDQLQPVVETYVRHADSLLKLSVAAAALITTADHPFLVKGRGWVKAGDLLVGDSLITPTGTALLAGVERVATGATVYNFQVAVNHDYYALAGSTPVLVHNADYGDLLSRPGQIADRFGATAREVKDAIHQAKTNLPRGGPVRNPDVSVDPVSGEIYPQLPGGGFGDSIGNMWELLGKG